MRGLVVTGGAFWTFRLETGGGTLPQILTNTVRNWLLLCEALAAKLNGLLVAPGRLVNPPPLLACHCNDGAGEPLAAAVKLAELPGHAAKLVGEVLITGEVLAVKVATLEVVLPQVLLKIARNWLPFCEPLA